MDLYRFTPGDSPVLISVPHAGTYLPPEIAARLTEDGRAVPDTDWHVHHLYEPAKRFGAGLLIANYSRFVVDLNRDPAGKPLYPGADNTEVVPTATFASQPVWQDDKAPTEDEVARRIERYWRPYHNRLASELERLKRRFGVAVLWDGHSIASEVPRFFAGRLPDLNLGTAKGTSCAEDLAAGVTSLFAASDFSWVRDGRFTGGYITRHYGRPADNVHALQLEVAQAAYMDEAHPLPWNPKQAARLMVLIETVVPALVGWAKQRSVA
ncbi:MAG: N-formylglutamate deformylase [Alphaproteobacteria bacterium]|nr:N-formylglutamate deformylase [Alphaproteobacteria bacterium]